MWKYQTRNVDIKKIFPFMGAILVTAIFTFATQGEIFSERNISVMVNNTIYIIAAVSAYSFMLAAGDLDFSIGANMGVSCAISCIVANIDPAFSIPAGILTGALIGLINATISVKLGINAFITTLAMMFVCNGLTVMILENGSMGAPVQMLKWFSTPFKLIVILFFIVGGYFIFEHTAYGKRLRVIGACPEAVRQSGVNVTLHKFMTFIIMGATCGFLGFISLIRTGTASAGTGSSLMMNVLNAVLIGGMPLGGGPTSRFRSVILGAIIILIMESGMVMLQFDNVTTQFVKAFIFIIAVGISFDRKNVKVIK